MLSDAEYFKSKMGKIDGSGDLGDTLIQVVNAKTILPEKDSASTVSPPPLPPSSTTSNDASPSAMEKDTSNQQANSESKTEKKGEDS